MIRTPAQRLRNWSMGLDPGWRNALALFLGLRVFASAWAALVLALLDPPTAPDPLLRPYQGVAPIEGGLAELVLGAWQRFDTLWFLRIASEGYALEDGSIVYLPLFPSLIRLSGDLLLGNHLLAALLISNASTLALLYLLYRITAAELGSAAARRASLYLAAFPTAFFLVAGYSESLFLALSLAAFLWALQSRWGLAGVAGALAAVTRLQGVLLLVPFAYLFWRRRNQSPQWGWLGLLLIPMASAGFLLYPRIALGGESLLGVYPGLLHAQFVLPWDNLLAAGRQILSPGRSLVDLLNLLATLLFGGMTLVVLRRLPPEYGLYMVATLVALMLRRTTTQPLVSMIRYGLTLFPVFMIWGAWGQNRRLHRLILYPSLALLLYLTGQFVMWGWVA